MGYKDVGWVFTKNAVTYILNGKNSSVYCYEWSGQMGIVLRIMKTCFGKPIVLNIYNNSANTLLFSAKTLQKYSQTDGYKWNNL